MLINVNMPDIMHKMQISGINMLFHEPGIVRNHDAIELPVLT